MFRKEKLVCIVFLFFQVRLLAQSNIVLHFTPTIDQSPLLLNQRFSLKDSKDSFMLTTFKFYISSISLYDHDKLSWTEQNSYHLVDIEQTDSILLFVPKGVSYDKIFFNIGIDSITNVSGAMGGDLDPLKGMYWTWQSGYINLKLEASKQDDDKIIYHLGGYSGDQNSLQTFSYPLLKNETILYFNFNLKDIFSLEKSNYPKHLMVPGSSAVELLKIIASKITLDRKR